MPSDVLAPVIKLVWMAVAAVVVIGAIATVIKIKAKRWENERRKKRIAKDRVDIEEMTSQIRQERRRNRSNTDAGGRRPD